MEARLVIPRTGRCPPQRGAVTGGSDSAVEEGGHSLMSERRTTGDRCRLCRDVVAWIASRDAGPAFLAGGYRRAPRLTVHSRLIHLSRRALLLITSLSVTRFLDRAHSMARHATPQRCGGGDRSRAPARRAILARSPRPAHAGGPNLRSAPPGRPRRSRAGRDGRCGGTSGHSAAPKLAAMIASNSARTHTGSAQTSSAKPRCSVSGSRAHSGPAVRGMLVPSISITPRVTVTRFLTDTFL
ncbi:hypothetical protein F4559_002861 [Saccharothrix violaceirubra]|uniref:Uncharacterized protein n=1 Tax=Saccharothrix violaceirubra TaxID=413306 RepID=A0A7W7T3R5_9PSEU|nr:hypothetical protein [Saccharothrix violaceirubra]